MSEYYRHIINDDDMENLIVDVKNWFAYYYDSQECIEEKTNGIVEYLINCNGLRKSDISKSVTPLNSGGVKTCEYQKINPNNENWIPRCAVNNKLCTFCVFGNAETYNRAKKQ